MTRFIFTAIACVLMLQGCVQVIVEKPDGTKYKLNTLAYKIDIDRFISDSFQIENYEGTPDKVKVTTPYGICETK